VYLSNQKVGISVPRVRNVVKKEEVRCGGLKGIETFQNFVKLSNSVYIFTGRLYNSV